MYIKAKTFVYVKTKTIVHVKTINFCVSHNKIFLQVGFYSVKLKRYFSMYRKAVATHEHNVALQNRSAMPVA